MNLVGQVGEANVAHKFLANNGREAGLVGGGQRSRRAIEVTVGRRREVAVAAGRVRIGHLVRVGRQRRGERRKERELRRERMGEEGERASWTTQPARCASELFVSVCASRRLATTVASAACTVDNIHPIFCQLSRSP